MFQEETSFAAEADNVDNDNYKGPFELLGEKSNDSLLENKTFLNVPLISLDDSQIDSFLPNSSPTLLSWNFSNFNLNDVDATAAPANKSDDNDEHNRDSSGADLAKDRENQVVVTTSGDSSANNYDNYNNNNTIENDNDEDDDNNNGSILSDIELMKGMEGDANSDDDHDGFQANLENTLVDNGGNKQATETLKLAERGGDLDSQPSDEDETAKHFSQLELSIGGAKDPTANQKEDEDESSFHASALYARDLDNDSSTTRDERQTIVLALKENQALMSLPGVDEIALDISCPSASSLQMSVLQSRDPANGASFFRSSLTQSLELNKSATSPAVVAKRVAKEHQELAAAKESAAFSPSGLDSTASSSSSFSGARYEAKAKANLTNLTNVSSNAANTGAESKSTTPIKKPKPESKFPMPMSVSAGSSKNTSFDTNAEARKTTATATITGAETNTMLSSLLIDMPSKPAPLVAKDYQNTSQSSDLDSSFSKHYGKALAAKSASEAKDPSFGFEAKTCSNPYLSRLTRHADLFKFSEPTTPNLASYRGAAGAIDSSFTSESSLDSLARRVQTLVGHIKVDNSFKRSAQNLVGSWRSPVDISSHHHTYTTTTTAAASKALHGCDYEGCTIRTRKTSEQDELDRYKKKYESVSEEALRAALRLDDLLTKPTLSKQLETAAETTTTPVASSFKASLLQLPSGEEKPRPRSLSSSSNNSTASSASTSYLRYSRTNLNIDELLEEERKRLRSTVAAAIASSSASTSQNASAVGGVNTSATKIDSCTSPTPLETDKPTVAASAASTLDSAGANYKSLYEKTLRMCEELRQTRASLGTQTTLKSDHDEEKRRGGPPPLPTTFTHSPSFRTSYSVGQDLVKSSEDKTVVAASGDFSDKPLSDRYFVATGRSELVGARFEAAAAADDYSRPAAAVVRSTAKSAFEDDQDLIRFGKVAEMYASTESGGGGGGLLMPSAPSFERPDELDEADEIAKSADKSRKFGLEMTAAKLTGPSGLDVQFSRERARAETMEAGYLKKMDKKLKKTIRHAQTKDESFLNGHKSQLLGPEVAYLRGRKEAAKKAVSWEISPAKDCEIKVDDDDDDAGLNRSFSSASLSSEASSDTLLSNRLSEQNLINHPYLPLRDVPVNSLVKKLREEFESDQDLRCGLPDDADQVWNSMKREESFEEDAAEKRGRPGEKLHSLKKLIDTPVRTWLKEDKSAWNALRYADEDDDEHRDDEDDHLKRYLHEKSMVRGREEQSSGRHIYSISRDLRKEPRLPEKANGRVFQSRLAEEGRNDEEEESNKLESDLRRKEKIKKLILAQQKQHAKRIKALEKLAKLERMQAEKLSEIFNYNNNNNNSSNATSKSMSNLLYESLLAPEKQSEPVLDKPRLTTTTTTTRKAAAEPKSEYRGLSSSHHRPSDSIRSQMVECERPFKHSTRRNVEDANLNNTRVEIVNVNDTSVSELTLKVKVVKELERWNKQNSNSERGEKPQPALSSDEPGDTRCFVSIREGSGAREKRPPIYARTQCRPESKVKRATSWFEPIGPADDGKRRTGVFRPAAVSSHVRVEFGDADHAKISLQEAFKLNNYDLICRSRQRQREIKLRSKERQLENELRLRMLEDQLFMASVPNHQHHRARHQHDYDQELQRGGAVTRYMPQQQQPPPPPRRRRTMTTKQIKEQNRKIYENLPEVKRKQKIQESEEIKKRNRLKYTIFKKAIQQRVLANGPNFKPGFKALEF